MVAAGVTCDPTAPTCDTDRTLIAVGLVGIGVSATMVGLAMWLNGRRQTGSPHVALAPGPGEAGLAIRVTW